MPPLARFSLRRDRAMRVFHRGSQRIRLEPHVVLIAIEPACAAVEPLALLKPIVGFYPLFRVLVFLV